MYTGIQKINGADQVRFDYLCDTTNVFAFTAGPDTAAEPAFNMPIEDGSWKAKPFSATIKTGSTPDWYIGMKNISTNKTTGTFVLENILVEESK